MDQEVTAFWRNVYKYLPPIRWRKRAGQMNFRESFFDAISDNTSDNAQMIKMLHQQKLEAELPNRQDLWPILTPNYSPGCKRIIISDDFFPALALPNVSLEHRNIDSIDGNHIKVKSSSSDGESTEQLAQDFDLLVCATGFKTVDFMHPIEMYGKNGRSIRDIWKDGAQAYYGVTVEDMPNFGMLYGPNTNLGHNSIILMIEAQSRYINGLIQPVLEARKQDKTLSLAPKAEKVKEYNALIQAELQKSSFNDPNCNSWYKNESGRITNNWSRTVVDYQQQLSKVEYRNYEAEGTGVQLVRDAPELSLGRVQEETSVSDRTLMAIGVLSTAAVVVGGFLARNTKYLERIRMPSRA